MGLGRDERWIKQQQNPTNDWWKWLNSVRMEGLDIRYQGQDYEDSWARTTGKNRDWSVVAWWKVLGSCIASLLKQLQSTFY